MHPATRRALLATAAAATTAACAPADRLVAPTPRAAAVHEASPPFAASRVDPVLAASVTRLLIEHVARGLLYTSESDYPFTYYTHRGPAPTPLTVAAFRAALALPAATPVEEISLDAFFARHIERVDPADSAAVALVPRYRMLRETLRYTLRQPRVFRVGRIAIHCYIVGTDWADDIVGLTTVSIET